MFRNTYKATFVRPGAALGRPKALWDVPGIPWDAPGLPWDVPGLPWGIPGQPGMSQGCPGTSQRCPGTSQGCPRTRQGSPGTSQGSPGMSQGCPEAPATPKNDQKPKAHPPKAQTHAPQDLKNETLDFWRRVFAILISVNKRQDIRIVETLKRKIKGSYRHGGAVLHRRDPKIWF